MSASAIGLFGAAASLLAHALGRSFLAGLMALAMAACALFVFVSGPPSFAATLVAGLSALAAWLVMLPSGRRVETIAAGAIGFLCASAAPHLFVLAQDINPDPALVGAAARCIMALLSLAIGSALAGPGAAILAFVGAALGLGLFEPGLPIRWLLAGVIVAAAFLTQRSTAAGVAGLVAASALTFWEVLP